MGKYAPQRASKIDVQREIKKKNEMKHEKIQLLLLHREKSGIIFTMVEKIDV